MNPTDAIALLVLALVVGAALAYVVRAKRRGVKCIGCPMAKSCSQNSGAAHVGGCSCSDTALGCGCGCNIEVKIDPELPKK